MTTNQTTTRTEGRDLIVTRIINAPRHKVFKAWTDPELLMQWFAPLPWTTPRAEMDVRPGGSSQVIMRGPDGSEFPNPGVYLDVVQDERIVATNAFAKAWEPIAKPEDEADCNALFMVLDLTFEDEDGNTRYTARARHWTIADREAHEKMGFHEGWSVCTEQLAKLVEAQ
jgi:uncharacterized protein YndB with AHSA1/START domain